MRSFGISCTLSQRAEHARSRDGCRPEGRCWPGASCVLKQSLSRHLYNLQEAQLAEAKEQERADELARRRQEEEEERRRYLEIRDAEERVRRERLEEEERLRADHKAQVERERQEAQAESEHMARSDLPEQVGAEDSGDATRQAHEEAAALGECRARNGDDELVALAMTWMVCMTEEREVGLEKMVAAVLEEILVAVQGAAGLSCPDVSGRFDFACAAARPCLLL